MSRKLTLGSLFDGIGGFCLAAQYADIQPVWASEIEPFPLRVTEKRFPDVLQLGDVHAVSGSNTPPVDIISFGSPCQNLSLAGRRAGLHGEQSSLFFEAVRIITEMREKTNGQYPRWAVFENVPGALSSNGGSDFRQILQSLCSIADKQADVPLPADGKWLGAGEIVGNGYSLAWRILDASKGWGVAQRRRRVFAVLDLAGECAGQVLFESEGLSGYSPPGIETRQGTAGCTEESAGIPGAAVEYNPTDSRIKIKDDGICQTLTARMGTGGNTVPLTLKIRSGCEGGGKGPLIQTDLSATLSTNNDQTLFDPKVYGICSDQSNAMLSDNPHSGFYEAETSRTLDCNGGNPVCAQGGMIVCAMNVGFFAATEEKAPALMARDWKDPPVVAPVSEYLVRRLTPDECCRLQGYPDGWCRGLASEEPSDEEVDRWLDIFSLWDGIQGKGRPRTRKQIIKWLKDPNTDSAEYKAYGNSVAVPCVFFVLAGIVWAAGKEGSE